MPLTENQRTVAIPAGQVQLPGILAWPAQASGMVLFAHGSGSGRLSPRNAAVAQQLRSAGIGTLLFDLLTEAEAEDRRNVFDIELLGRRLVTATEWLSRQPEARGLHLGYFGASTGAAAALKAAVVSPIEIGAVVSRGGRPDLAGAALPQVRSPTLLLVGSRDTAVLGLNQMARAQMNCLSELVVIPNAGHLFEEPGTLEEAGRLAAGWFVQHLRERQTVGRPLVEER
jgi:putative phosphoribosyl transferase